MLVWVGICVSADELDGLSNDEKNLSKRVFLK